MSEKNRFLKQARENVIVMYVLTLKLERKKGPKPPSLRKK